MEGALLDVLWSDVPHTDPQDSLGSVAQWHSGLCPVVSGLCCPSMKQGTWVSLWVSTSPVVG